MNILLVNKFFYLNGGSETVFFQERDFLLAKGHDVVDFSMVDARNRPSPYADFFVPHVSYKAKGGPVQKLRQALSFIHSPVAVRQLEKLIHQKKPDIAHLHNIYHQLTPSIIPALKKNGVRVVLTLHDFKLVCPGYLALNKDKICTACFGGNYWHPIQENCQNSLVRGFLLATESTFHAWRQSYDGVDLFLAPSRFLAEQVAHRVSRNKIRVLHNGIDEDAYQPHQASRGYALYFGRISREKGVPTLLRAYRLAALNMPLVIVGTGPLARELEQKYPEARFMGYRSGGELKNIVAGAAFVVVPSEWYENCSMVILEAMALGRPVIGSRIGGIPEQIEDGKTGLLFSSGNIDELAEKMKFLATDTTLRKKMGRAARKKVEQEYSLAEHNRRLLDIYFELVGKK